LFGENSPHLATLTPARRVLLLYTNFIVYLLLAASISTYFIMFFYIMKHGNVAKQYTVWQHGMFEVKSTINPQKLLTITV
jgi:hypothetical protein